MALSSSSIHPYPAMVWSVEHEARFIFEDGVPAVELIILTKAETRPDTPAFERRKIDQIVETALRLDTGGNDDRIVEEPQRR